MNCVFEKNHVLIHKVHKKQVKYIYINYKLLSRWVILYVNIILYAF